MRSSRSSAGLYRGPRRDARVSPEPSKWVGPMLKGSRWGATFSKTVGNGCHSSGSGPFSQLRALNRWLLSGLCPSYPIMPWAPGGSPVPKLVRLVAVVEGNPAWRRRALLSRERRKGAWPLRRRRSSSPRPSTRTTTALRAWGRSVFHSLKPGTFRECATEGKTPSSPCVS